MTTPVYAHPMRRARRAFPWQTCLDLLRRGAWGVLSLSAPDGQPYGVPLNYALLDPGSPTSVPPDAPAVQTSGSWADAEEGGVPPGYTLVFHSAPDGLKRDILDAAPRACFTVVLRAEVNPAALSTGYESVMAFGPVRRLDPGENGHDEALRHLGRRFCADCPEAVARTLEKSGPRTTAWLLDIRGLTGKFNPAR